MAEKVGSLATAVGYKLAGASFVGCAQLHQQFLDGLAACRCRRSFQKLVSLFLRRET
jgi:hypothetical protein